MINKINLTKFTYMKPASENKAVPNLHPKFFWEYRFDDMDWEEAYMMVIDRIIERGEQKEVDEIVRFYGYERVIKALKQEITFMTNIAINNALSYFPELTKEQMVCYINRKDKPYHWI